MKIKTYVPWYCRAPNRLIRYEDRLFDDGCGHTGIETIAIYKDKNGKLSEETARIKWDQPYNAELSAAR